MSVFLSMKIDPHADKGVLALFARQTENTLILSVLMKHNNYTTPMFVDTRVALLFNSTVSTHISAFVEVLQCMNMHFQLVIAYI